MRKHRKHLIVIWNELLERGYVSVNIWKKSKAPKDQLPDRRGLRPSELREFLSRLQDPATRLVVIVACCTGLRFEEILSLKRHCIHSDGLRLSIISEPSAVGNVELASKPSEDYYGFRKEIRARKRGFQSKHWSDRTVALERSALLALERLLSEEAGEHTVSAWNSATKDQVYHQIRKTASNRPWKKLMHAFRRYYASASWKYYQDIHRLQAALGHKRLFQTFEYLDTLDPYFTGQQFDYDELFDFDTFIN